MQNILATVNILPRSVLFIDDNPVERAAMRQAFPDMRILGCHPYYIRRILLWSSETQVPSITEESAKRTGMVQAQLEREKQKSFMSREDFLAYAAPRVAIFEVDSVYHPRFPRCLELINKTNQFNTTGAQRKHEAMESLFRDGGRMFAFEAADRYTAYGLVGVVVLLGAHIEQWVMSCRVLGYEIEDAVMARVVEFGRQADAEITATLIETDVNFPCRGLFPRLGFVHIGKNTWRLPDDTVISTPPHVLID
jgi:FkbH-like protein